MGKYKKMVKASVEEAIQQVADGSDDPFVKAKADYTKKDIRLEAKNLRKTGSEIKMSDLYKMIPSDAKGLLSMVKTEKGEDAVQNMGYTQMPDGSKITMMSDLKKHCYNSKKKKK